MQILRTQQVLLENTGGGIQKSVPNALQVTLMPAHILESLPLLESLLFLFAANIYSTRIIVIGIVDILVEDAWSSVGENEK